MKMKAVLKSLLIAYGITGVFLLFLALALFSFDLSEKAVRAGILAAYILACLTGGYGAGKMLRKEKSAELEQDLPPLHFRLPELKQLLSSR